MLGGCLGAWGCVVGGVWVLWTGAWRGCSCAWRGARVLGHKILGTPEHVYLDCIVQSINKTPIVRMLTAQTYIWVVRFVPLLFPMLKVDRDWGQE